MAEFVQMMKDWSRMCLSFKSCGDCPMMDEDGRAHILCSEGGIRSAVPEVQEDVIIKWAAEHPEPVYPAWRDWLRMSDSRFMAHIIGEICEYAKKNGMEPNDTLETIADIIKALLKISTFNNWKEKQHG